MTELLSISIPSLVALLIAAMALRRTADDANSTDRRARETEIRQELTDRRVDSVSQRQQIAALTAQVGELTTLLDAANMKLLRELLKKNGSTNTEK